MSKKALGNYQKVQTFTATPIQRVVMVYNGIIKNLNVAYEVLSSPDNDPQRFETINNSIQLAERLIHELAMALDKEQGGELAERLAGLYAFWISHLSKANREKSPAKVQEVLKMVQELSASWEELERQSKSGQPG